MFNSSNFLKELVTGSSRDSWKAYNGRAEVGTRSMSKPIEFIAWKSFFEIKNTVI